MRLNTNYNVNSPQFQGYNFFRRKAQYSNIQKQVIANIIGQDVSEVVKDMKNASKKQWSFLSLLTDQYNKKNYYKPLEEKENVNLVKKIVQLVKKPHREHFSITARFKGSMETLSRIFESINNSDKKLLFAYRINKEILSKDNDSYDFLLPELLESPNSNIYANNYNKFRSYIKLNKNKDDAVTNLDKMIKDGTFNQQEYDKLIERQEHIDAFPFNNTEVFNSEIYSQNYTEERNTLMQLLRNEFCIINSIDNNKIDHILKSIFDTTNKENVDLRAKIIKTYPSQNMNQDIIHDKLQALNQLFATIEKDKYAKSFVTKLTDHEVAIDSVIDINKILDNIPSAKLDIFSDNAFRLINMVRGINRIPIMLRELDNPFFETELVRFNRKKSEKYGFRKKQNFISKLIKRVINNFRIMRYKKLQIDETKLANQITPQENIITNTRNLDSEVQIAINKPTDTGIPETEQVIPQPEADTPIIETPVINKKEEIRNNIFDFLNLKLGKSTFAKQKEAYGKNATKMKLSMLPEIFASVAETRKVDRAVGKLRINSSNKDVLDLYLLINGSNKKYINYLLKKRNSDGTRMFEIKDIITIIRKAEAKIADNKKQNPNYRARDARQYYNHLYEAKVQQYGKVTRVSKKTVPTPTN